MIGGYYFLFELNNTNDLTTYLISFSFVWKKMVKVGILYEDDLIYFFRSNLRFYIY